MLRVWLNDKAAGRTKFCETQRMIGLLCAVLKKKK
jgi:hypothetical protein